jgi:DNA replication protein DnaC
MNKVKCTLCYDTGWTVQVVGDKKKEYAKRCKCISIQNEKKFTPEFYQVQWDANKYDLDYLKMGIGFLNNPYERILLLWGKSDIGKTLLSWKLKNEYAKTHGYRWTYHIKNKQLQNILHLMGLGTFDDRMESVIESHKSCIYSKLLVIDDFWTDPESKTEKFIAAFETFFDSLLSKKIIITINDNPEEIKNAYPTTYNRFRRPENGWQWIEMKRKGG